MCYLTVYIVFDFPESVTLKDPAILTAGVTALQDDGFLLEGEAPAAEAWGQALRRGTRSAYLAFKGGLDLTLSVVLNQPRRLYCATPRPMALKPEGARAFVDAAQTLWNALLPDFGFGLISLDTQMLEAPAVGDYRIKTVYDYNFLSERLLKPLGSQTLKAVPGARVAALAGGGALLEVVPHPLGDRKPTLPTYQTAAALLGAASFQQGC
jgi:hypothetical protein